jgi:two-component system, OmpR family, KDP operon response regulator KdpE
VTTTANPRILLVEDDPLLRHAFMLLLEANGYRVGEAGTARDAIAKATTELPDLILLDLGLPDASGLDVARTLRKEGPLLLTPIIALTGRVGPDEKAACIEAGCTSYLAKPIEPKTLMKRLQEFLAD